MVLADLLPVVFRFRVSVAKLVDLPTDGSESLPADEQPGAGGGHQQGFSAAAFLSLSVLVVYLLPES